MQPKDKFDLAREQIRHEDSLVANRVSWFLVFQGLLFSAFVDAVKLLLDADNVHKEATFKGAFILGLVGIGASVVAFMATRTALQQIDAVVHWWEQQRIEGFPPIAGNRGSRSFGSHPRTAIFLLAFAAVWVALLLILICP